MEKMLFWLVRWPWIAAAVVFAGLTQLQLGPWYLSIWLMLGIAVVALIVARAERAHLLEAMVLPTRPGQSVHPHRDDAPMRP